MGEFLCSYFNTEDRRKKQYLGHFMLYYFKKGKKATETQEGTCAVFREGGMTDQM